MASCAYCKKTILLGGVHQEGFRFCNKDCLAQGQVVMLAASMPEADRVRAAQTLFRLLCCRTCALKKQGSDFGLSLLAGWWGIPFGLIFTPLALLRNGYAMLFPPNRVEPSAAFQQEVVLRLAASEAERRLTAQDNPIAKA